MELCTGRNYKFRDEIERARKFTRFWSVKKKEKKSPSEEASKRNRSIRVSNKDANTIREESNKDREREREVK